MPTHPNQPPPVVRAGIYTRTRRLRRALHRPRLGDHALLRGRRPVAYSARKRRAHEEMLGAVEDGALDAIAPGTTTGSTAPPRELEAFIDLVERSGVRVAVVSGGDYDLTTPDGRFTARIVGAVARKESEDRSRRVRRKHLELAEHGRPAGQLGWDVRTEAERELVREAAARYPCAATARSGSGWSGRSNDCTRWWTEPAGNASCCTPTPRALWSSADFGQRRELVRLIVERVEVLPARCSLRRVKGQAHHPPFVVRQPVAFSARLEKWGGR